MGNKVKNNKDVMTMLSVFGFNSDTIPRSMWWRAASLCAYIMEKGGGTKI